MSTWDGLLRRIDEIDPLDRRLQAERARFETWAASVEARVMEDLGRVAREKAREARSRTGVSIVVESASSARPGASFGGAHRRLTLSFAGSSVDIYSTRPEGQSPNVHLACQRAPTTSRYPVVVTLPGCMVIRSDEPPGYRLLGLPDRSSTDPEAFVLRAFGVLVGSFESVLAMRTLVSTHAH